MDKIENKILKYLRKEFGSGKTFVRVGMLVGKNVESYRLNGMEILVKDSGLGTISYCPKVKGRTINFK